MNTNSTTTSSAALRIIISGGGTGGHIFPAISIANALKALRPDADILFVGAEGRMEMQRVPDAGYRIIGLPVAGFDRRHLWKNISVIAKLLRSQWQARRIVREFRPQAAVGVGGYASGPMLKACALAGIPTLIQEQNSYAGVTNKLLAKQAAKICVAYDGMERFFPAGKIILTGNPVRQNLLDNPVTREQAAAHFGLDPQKKTILVLGGSRVTRRGRLHLGVLPAGQARHPGALAQRGRRPSDQECPGPGAEGRRPLREGCRRPRTTGRPGPQDRG